MTTVPITCSVLYCPIHSKQVIGVTRNHLIAAAWRSTQVNFSSFLVIFLAKKLSPHGALLIWSWCGYPSQQCAKHLPAAEADKDTLRCARRSAPSRARDVRPLRAPPCTREPWVNWSVFCRGPPRWWDLDCLPWEQRPGNMHSATLEKRRFYWGVCSSLPVSTSRVWWCQAVHSCAWWEDKA